MRRLAPLAINFRPYGAIGREESCLALRLKDYACFTRPENKVERLSYDVMTPSAARGVLEAIYWKPEITWRIDRIAVLQPIRTREAD